jgi:hypothetical protein
LSNLGDIQQNYSKEMLSLSESEYIFIGYWLQTKQGEIGQSGNWKNHVSYGSFGLIGGGFDDGKLSIS